MGDGKIDERRLEEAIGRASRHSQFLGRLIEQYSEIPDSLRTNTVDEVLSYALAVTETSTAKRLRVQRSRVVLGIALADLSGVWGLEQVVAALSDFADCALQEAISEAIGVHVPGADARGFAAIALGKHGSRELNYSSDIDPIFIYDPATLPRRSREEPAEAAVRIARRVVDLLQARDGDGFVFRVDLRLRPASEATPIALPVEAAIGHYESSALTWERAAFIRARAAAGDKGLGQAFLDTVQPFVWRRSLDFGAVDELRALTRSIRATHGRAPLGPGYDVKRGRGGIREVEFYTQIHQLIHGGRDPALRSGATLSALSALAAAGWIEEDAVEALGTAYRLLRTIEHRLQLVDDRQTHEIPVDPDAREEVAHLHGLASGDALLALLGPHVARVESLYDALDDAGRARGPGAERSAPAAAFADTPESQRRIARWRGGGVRAIRSPAAVAAFEALLPEMLADLARAPDPDAALARLDQVLGGLSSGVNLFRLLDAQPALRVTFVDILSHAPILASALASRPPLLDRLVDQTAFDAAPDLSALTAEMRVGEGDLEATLDHVRRIVGEYRFALGTQIVVGTSDPMDVARGYGRVAEAAVEVVTTAVIRDFESAHGKVPGGEFVILALGRLGGGLLTHASDLDLIYLFTGDYSAESDGRRPLGATHYFNRLAQRVTAALSVPTSVGALYEIDTRLRPSGAQGPLVVSLDSFERYQREAAWTWEHMALTRARPVFGTAASRAALATVIGAALRQPIAVRRLARDVVAMRGEITAHKPPKGALDVKLQSGGLVDLEFVVHFHQLAGGVGFHPDLNRALADLTARHLVEPGLVEAHDLMTRLLVTMRLITPELGVPVAASRPLVARACGKEDWTTLLADLEVARHCVVRHWEAVKAQAEEQA